MNVRHIIVNALVFGSLAAAPAALMAADQLRTQDRLHASDVTATQLQTQQRDRLHAQDAAAAGSRVMTQSRSQARTSAATRTSTQTRTQQRDRIHK
jgi:hypothetical protein